MWMVGWQNKVHSLALTAFFIVFRFCPCARVRAPCSRIIYCFLRSPPDPRMEFYSMSVMRSEKRAVFEKHVSKRESWSTWQMLLTLIKQFRLEEFGISTTRTLHENRVFIHVVHCDSDSMLTIKA